MLRHLAVALPLLVALLAGCTAPAPAADNGCAGVQRSSLDVPANHTVALLSTSKGCIVAELFDDQAPITVANFRAYASEQFFDGVLFHRIISGFMVQTGGMGTDGAFKDATHPMIQNEARASGLKNTAYTLSMARMGRNPDGTGDGANTATNQFFINHADTRTLAATASSAGYAVFGKVVQGRDVVDAIAATPVETYDASTSKHCQRDNSPSCPVTDVVLQAVRLL